MRLLQMVPIVYFHSVMPEKSVRNFWDFSGRSWGRCQKVERIKKGGGRMQKVIQKNVSDEVIH